MTLLPWPSPAPFCRACGAEHDTNEPDCARWDFAGGHHELCFSCWRRWVVSREYREAAASPCPDKKSLAQWLVAQRSVSMEVNRA